LVATVGFFDSVWSVGFGSDGGLFPLMVGCFLFWSVHLIGGVLIFRFCFQLFDGGFRQ
jgi:hypothetical protein